MWYSYHAGGEGRGGVLGQEVGLGPLCCTHRCVRWMEHQPGFVSFVSCPLSFVGWFLFAVSAVICSLEDPKLALSLRSRVLVSGAAGSTGGAPATVQNEDGWQGPRGNEVREWKPSIEASPPVGAEGSVVQGPNVALSLSLIHISSPRD